MQALINTAERLEGMPGESQEMLESAFEIAGSLRKLLQDRDKQFANLESTCLVRKAGPRDFHNCVTVFLSTQRKPS